MNWLTIGNARKTLSSNLKTFLALQQAYDKKGQGDPLNFIKWLLTTDSAENFKTELSNLGLGQYADDATGENLEQLVNQIQDLGKAKYSPLLHPLSALDVDNLASDIKIKLFESTEQQDLPNVGDISLNLAGGGNGAITLEGNGLENPPANQRAVSVMLDGTLQAKLGAQLPISFGALSGYAGFEAGGKIKVEYLKPDNTLFLDAVVDIVSQIEDGFNPLKLSSIKEQLSPDTHFHKVAIDLNGKLSYGANMKLGVKKSIANLKSNLKAATNIGYDGSLAGEFTLEVEPQDENTVTISIRRTKTQIDSSNFGLTINLDASEVATQVESQIKEKLAGPAAKLQEAINKVNEILTPGEYIESKLTNLINDASVGQSTKDALLASTKLALGTGDEDTALKALTKNISKTLGRKYLFFSADTPSKVSEFIAELAQSAGVDENSLSELNSKVATTLADIDSDFDAKLTEAVQNRASDLLAIISNMGEQYQKFINKPDTQVKKAKSALIQVLKDTQTRTNDFVKKISDKDNYQISADLKSKLSKTQGSDLMLKYSFDFEQGNIEQLQHCYELLLRGKANQIFALTKEQSIPGLKVIEGVLTTNTDIEASDKLHLSFFGIDVDYENLLNIKSKVIQNASGDIVALSEADYKSNFSSGGIKQNARFIDAFNIAVAQYSTLNLNFSMSVADKSFTLSEVQFVLDELIEFEILTQEVKEQITADFIKMAKGKSALNALISFKLKLDNWQSGDFLGLDMGENTMQQTRFIQAFEVLSDFRLESNKKAKLLDTLETKKKIADQDEPNALANFMYQLNPLQYDDLSGQIGTGPARVAFDSARQFAEKAHSFAKLCQVMRTIYVKNSEAIDDKWLTEQQQQIGQCLEPWVQSFSDLTLFFRPNIANSSNRFTKLLMEIAGSTKPVKMTVEAIYEGGSFSY